MSDQIPSNNKPDADSRGKGAGEANQKEEEIGGFEDCPEPTRYGDWEVNGRCSDF